MRCGRSSLPRRALRRSNSADAVSGQTWSPQSRARLVRAARNSNGRWPRDAHRFLRLAPRHIEGRARCRPLRTCGIGAGASRQRSLQRARSRANQQTLGRSCRQRSSCCLRRRAWMPEACPIEPVGYWSPSSASPQKYHSRVPRSPSQTAPARAAAQSIVRSYADRIWRSLTSMSPPRPLHRLRLFGSEPPALVYQTARGRCVRSPPRVPSRTLPSPAETQATCTSWSSGR